MWEIENARGHSYLLVAVLQAGLETNFAEVKVSVVECPDLTKDPFQFPVKGKSLLQYNPLHFLLCMSSNIIAK